MYYRVTTYGFDTGRFDEFMELANSLRDELRGIEGLEMIHSCQTDNEEGMIIARYDSEESATAAQPKVREVLGQMAGFMTSQPEIRSGNVIWEL
jgi:heme-degrading monooxygenase HmoA